MGGGGRYRIHSMEVKDFLKVRGDSTFDGDVTVKGTFTFGDAAVDTLVLKGRVATGSTSGTQIDLGATYTYGQGFYTKYNITSWTGIGTDFDGMYIRAQNGVSGTGKTVKGLEVYGCTNNFNIGDLKGILSYAYIKGASAKTVGTAYAVQAELTWDAGAAATTITTEATPLMAKITGGVCADYTKIQGMIIRAGDMDGASRTYGNAILIEDDSAMAGAITWTKGLSITSITTTAISITGVTGTGVAISGVSSSAGGKAFTSAGFTLNNGNLGDGVGVVEADLTLTGTVAGFVSASSAWVNMASVTIGSHMVCAQTNGLWSDTGGVLTNGTFVFGMRADCLLQTNGGAGGATFYPFSVVNNTNTTTAVFLCNDATTDLGETTISEGAATYVPLFSDNEGLRYVKVFKAT